MSSAKKLVIVESPTKAKTIRKFLGDEYRVEASMGHVRDLPEGAKDVPATVKSKIARSLGVDVENGFTPFYVVPKAKTETVASLKRALKEADELFIATDEDREGESIGWHLVELLKPKVPTHRMVFHEITKDAIQKALKNTREINQQLVNAQEARRVLDRIVGYTISPLLWYKITRNLSAGRVQSVAVRMLVERERQRIAFVKGSYWGIKASVQAEKGAFDATLHAIDGKRTATGKDFDKDTGKLTKGSKALLLEEPQARALGEDLKSAQWKVTQVERKENTRSSYPPFTTSTLQQEANRKLGYSASDTMKVAQGLYEKGLITYMRTDSVNLSDEAVNSARGRIDRLYGKNFLSKAPRQFATKSLGAQEAHEAIRPAGTEMRTADELNLKDREYRLYDLIWKRTMATQMADAVIANTSVHIEAKTDKGEVAEFRAAGREVVFPGFLRAYVEGADDPASALDDQDSPLPQLAQNESVKPKTVTPEGHETMPPARYTEASLVKALEDEGIGRPSTYASIIGTIQRRGYVITKNKQLVPTFTAMAVTNLLEQTHGRVVDTKFTAGMETRLDQIATSEDARAFLSEVYGEVVEGVESGKELDPREMCTIRIDRIAPVTVRVGKFGPYLEFPPVEEGEKPQTASIPDDIAPADLTPEQVAEIAARAERREQVITIDPVSGKEVYLMDGRFGAYLMVGKPDDDEKPTKTVSIPPNISPTTLTEETALKLLSLPRVIGEHPETGKPVRANFGRFGPYVEHNKVFASLQPKLGDDVFTVTMDRALELFALKASGGRGGAAAPIRVIGEHPTGQELAIYNGRYGAYIKFGDVNATIPKDADPANLTLEEAIALVDAKVAAGPSKPKSKARTTKATASKAKATTKTTTTKAKATATKTSKAKAAVDGGGEEPAAPKATKAKSTKPKAEAAEGDAPAKKTRAKAVKAESAEATKPKTTRTKKAE